jgi:hypothetical protein
MLAMKPLLSLMQLDIAPEEAAARWKNSVQPRTSCEDVSSKLVFKEAGINDLEQIVLEILVLALFCMRSAMTFSEVFSAKVVNAVGSDVKEHLRMTGGFWTGGSSPSDGP